MRRPKPPISPRDDGGPLSSLLIAAAVVGVMFAAIYAASWMAAHP